MKPPQNSNEEKNRLRDEQKDLLVKSSAILRSTENLLEKLRENMRKFAELLKQKDKR